MDLALTILCLIDLMLMTGISVFLWLEFKERTRFKAEARALIETHNALMLRMQDVERKVIEAQVGVNYLKSKEGAGRRP